MSTRSAIPPVCLPLPLIFIALIAVTATMSGSTHPAVKKIVPIVEDLKKQLHISSAIQIKIVASNRLGLSVEPANHSRDNFLLVIDTHLLKRLDEEELRAALAHELGHVWIYTHHPYLHTEALANQIAMQAVTRNALKKLYAELWSFDGSPGNIDELLGKDLVATKSGVDKR